MCRASGFFCGVSAVSLTQIAICTGRWDDEMANVHQAQLSRKKDAGNMFAGLVKMVQGRCATCLGFMGAEDADLDHFCCSHRSVRASAGNGQFLLSTDPFGSASKMGEFLRLRGVHSTLGIWHPVAHN